MGRDSATAGLPVLLARATPAITWAVIAILAVPAVAAVKVIASEAGIARAQSQLQEQTRAAIAGYDTPLATLPGEPENDTPRARLAYTNMLVRAAATAPADARREDVLQRAAAQIDGLLASRRRWPEALVLGASLADLRGRPNDAARLLGESYAAGGYLRHAAAWRIGYAFANWDALTPETRTRAIDEAVWLARTDGTVRDGIFDRARLSPAYRPMLLRWRQIRLPALAAEAAKREPRPR